MSGSLAASLAGLALATTLLLPPGTPQDTERSAYDRAYVLEHEDRAYEAALKLYERVAADRGADAELRARARRRAQACSEEIASSDFAAIMPGNAILYLELNRPGAQLSSLLDQLGLLGSWEKLVEEGARSFAISPDLIDGTLGVRGAAVAITGIPMGDGPPSGVLVLHPGDNGVARGMIETALPAGGVAVDPIEGRPTWRVEDQVFVTLTARMLVASSSRQEIAGVLKRMAGNGADSLAANASMRANLALRDNDLVYMCFNAEPIRPMVSGLIGMMAAQEPEVAAAAALLDVESFESVVARAGVDEDGLSLDAVLRLEEGHRNLAFNFLRWAPVDRQLLRTIPNGVAAFTTSSFNERGPAIAPLHTNANDEPAVSGMDLGREVFANMVGVSLFVMPSEGQQGWHVPAVAAVISSNDPARSRAIWNLGLGLASLASGGVSFEPGDVQIAGHPAEKYVAAENIPIYLVQHETELVISPSQEAIASALHARDEGHSVLRDPAFAEELGRLGEGTTGVAMLHVGRLAQTALPFLPPDAQEEAAPYLGMTANTVLSMTDRYSDNELGFHMALRGLPKVDGLVAKLLEESKASASHTEVVHAHPDSVVTRVEPEGKDLRQAFDLLAERGDVKDAHQVAKSLVVSMEHDARALNNFAWALLTEERYGQRFDELALHVSLLSNEASGYGQWQYLDTLALAKFRHGDVDGAIELEKKALELVDDAGGRIELESTLRRFEEARRDVVKTRGQ